jgi:two-component system chemotaxis response regulator CheY
MPMARVLVIDDNLIARKQVRSVLEEAGHEVVGEAADGDSAPQLVQDLQPDLVTLDIVMPGRDGLATLRHLMLRDPHTRVLMCTASGTEAHVDRALQLGARGFYAKPVESARLLEAVDRALAA